MSTPLNPRQAAFVTEYLIDLNGTQAAIRAGYSPRSAEVTASRLLSDAKVSAAIAEAKAARMERTETTADDVIRELKRIAFLDPRQVMSWGPDGVRLLASSSLSPDVAAAIAEVSETTTEGGGSLRVKWADKISALRLLMQHLSMLTEKLEVKTTNRLELVKEIVEASVSAAK